MGNAFVKLHLAILLAGFTGILGKLIELPEGPLVWYRMLMTSVLLWGGLSCMSAIPRTSWREVAKISGIGAVLAIHWMFFYGSIKYANVSIAVVCFATVGFFTAICEPLFERRRISLRELGFSLITVLGVALIFHFDTRYRTGIILGVLAAVLSAFYAIATRRVGAGHNATTMLFYQMSGGFLFVTLAAPAYLALFPGIATVPAGWDLLWLFCLASICTIGLFLLQIQALRSISAFTVNLSFNLEPVYSIALAMLIFDEASDLGLSFFIGLGLICMSVALQSIYAARKR